EKSKTIINNDFNSPLQKKSGSFGLFGLLKNRRRKRSFLHDLKQSQSFSITMDKQQRISNEKILRNSEDFDTQLKLYRLVNKETMTSSELIEFERNSLKEKGIFSPLAILQSLERENKLTGFH